MQELKPSVLLVDDKVHELRELTALLTPHFTVRMASSGRQGFERAQATPPNLILLDVSMPDMDGFAVCRLLKASPYTQDIPVIFLTSHSDPEHRLKGLRLGAVDYVGKPFSAEEVLVRAQIHLRLHQRLAGPAPPEEAPEAAEGSSYTRAASRYIQENLHEQLAVDEVAHAIGVSPKQLREIFKTSLGMTVSMFIAEQRILLGSRLLRETRMPVQDIAMEVGFKNPGNFATAFRERMGLTPNAYRHGLKP